MKPWLAFHQLLQTEVDPLLKDYGFELVEASLDTEGVTRTYALPEERGGIAIDVIRRIGIDKNLLPFDMYWLKFEGGIRSSEKGDLLPIEIMPDYTPSLDAVDSEIYMRDIGWLYRDLDELQTIVNDLKTKLQSTLKHTNMSDTEP